MQQSRLTFFFYGYFDSYFEFFVQLTPCTLRARTVIKISCKEGQVPHLTKNLVKQLKPWRSIRRQFFCRMYLSRLSIINQEIFADLLFLQLRVLGAGSNGFLEKILILIRVLVCNRCLRDLETAWTILLQRG